jgi:teichuronic acid biosynthesis glycosyltransferase TuaC
MTEPLRVLFVVPGDGRGSSMIFVRRQAESVTREGVEVRSFYLGSRTSLWALVREFFRFRAELARFDPAVIHAHYGTVTAMFAALACGGRPLIVTYRGSDLNRSLTSHGMRSWWGRLLSQLAALRAARIVCVSQDLRERLWWRRNRVTVLPTGVDCEIFRPEDREAARRRLGLKETGWRESARVILFNAGYDRRNKRLDLAERAVAMARDKLPDLRLEILNGEVDPSRVPELMNGSDCLLLTSDREGSPTVVQEALACGLPVVSVDVGDVAARLAGVTNTCIVPRDAAAIAHALVELTTLPLRTNGPASVDDFSSRRIAQRLCCLYGEVAQTAA